MSARTLYTPQWVEDTEFQEAMARARVMSTDVLEDEAHRRAVEGWLEPVGWYKGEPGGVVRRYSDTLLIWKMKGELPEKYKDRVEVRGALANLDIAALPDDLVARLARGEHPMSVLAGVELPERREALTSGEAAPRLARPIDEGTDQTENPSTNPTENPPTAPGSKAP